MNVREEWITLHGQFLAFAGERAAKGFSFAEENGAPMSYEDYAVKMANLTIKLVPEGK